MKIRKAILPVAGLGTRFLPATKAQPKEMLPIVDKPIIQHLVEEAVASGIKEIIFVTGRGKRAIEDHFDYAAELEQHLRINGKKESLKAVREISNMAKFTYVRQKEQKGDGDALLAASHLVNNEPVAVLYGDDLVFNSVPCLKQLIDVFDKYNDSVVALEKIPRKEISKYGIVEGVKISSRLYEIKRAMEKPKLSDTKSDLAIVGKYIITPEIFDELRKINPRGKEVRLVDALSNILKRKAVYGYQFFGRRFDCGSKIGFLKATVDYGLTHKEIRNDFKKYLKSVKI